MYSSGIDFYFLDAFFLIVDTVSSQRCICKPENYTEEVKGKDLRLERFEFSSMQFSLLDRMAVIILAETRELYW